MGHYAGRCCRRSVREHCHQADSVLTHLLASMTSAIITIGDELLIGQIINTNQAYIAERLNSVGVSVEKMLTVGDHMSAIVQAFRECWAAYHIVIVTGGLGPTHDDITK